MMKPVLTGALAASLALAAPAFAGADDHPELAGPVKAFHDRLSPNWHSAPGAARNAAACAGAADYASLANDIVSAPVPRSAARGWPAATAGLRDAAIALTAYCASGHGGNVLAGLTTLHDRFHDLMETLRSAEAE